MNGKQLLQKLRPTAVVFAVVMAVIVWYLIKQVLGGTLGQAAFGDGQAASIVTAALIVVGTAVASLGNALLKLSEDSPDPPPAAVPESSHQALIGVLAQRSDAGEYGQQVVTDSHQRPREQIDKAPA